MILLGVKFKKDDEMTSRRFLAGHIGVLLNTHLVGDNGLAVATVAVNRHIVWVKIGDIEMTEGYNQFEPQK